MVDLKKGLIIAGSIVGAFLILFVGLFAYYQNKANEYNNAAAQPSSASTESVQRESTESADSSRDDMKERLLSESIELDFVAANNGEYSDDDVIKAIGEASVVTSTDVGSEFYFTTEESEDGYGVYKVTIYDVNTEFEEGDEVTIYGTVELNSEGVAQINALIID